MLELEENPQQKRVLFLMRLMRIIAAAFVAMTLLYFIHKKQLKDNPPENTTPTQTSTQTQPESQE